MIDTGIALLDLAIAILGLGGGSYLGTRRAGLVRMRVEDRRQLLDDWLPRVKDPTMGVLDSAGFVAELEEWGQASSKIDHAVEFLTWTERQSWRLAQAKSPDEWLALQHEIYLSVGSRSDTSIEIDEFMSQNGGWAAWLSAFSDYRRPEPARTLDPVATDLREWYRRLDDFELHLHRLLRPTVIHRLAAGAYSWRLVKRWPKRQLGVGLAARL